MAKYIIGDIHGYFETLIALLKKIDFRPKEDSLWFTGDLINGGPTSLEVLRWCREHAMSMQERLLCVLGNHDMHFLARSVGAAPEIEGDTLDALFEAPDLPELVDWLRRQPLLFVTEDIALVHAGIPPGMSKGEAMEIAASLQNILRSDDWEEAFASLYLEGKISDAGLLARCCKAFCCIRMCALDGTELEYNGTLEQAPKNATPWYDLLDASWNPYRFFFGHWAAHGLQEARAQCLDSGCTWGRGLTALRLDDGKFFRQETITENAE